MMVWRLARAPLTWTAFWTLMVALPEPEEGPTLIAREAERDMLTGAEVVVPLPAAVPAATGIKRVVPLSRVREVPAPRFWSGVTLRVPPTTRVLPPVTVR